MSLIEDLEKLGVNAKSAVDRFGGDEELFTALLEGLIDDLDEYDVLSAFEEGDNKTTLENAHALKGATGNVGINNLYDLYKKLNEQLKNEDLENARATIDELMPIQIKIVECIKEYI